MDKVTKYMTFSQLGNLHNMPFYEVTNNKSGGLLAFIEWYSPWRQYCLFPEEGVVFNDSRLMDIVVFLKELRPTSQKGRGL